MANYVIGDVHGHFDDLVNMVIDRSDDRFIQIGDLGVGFGPRKAVLPPNTTWIRGNHDNPSESRNHPRYLGEFGVTDDGIFFVSGAATPEFDRVRRIEGRDWWRDEELSYAQLSEAIELYKQTKPSIVIAHDAPLCLYRGLLGAVKVWHPGAGNDLYENTTAKALNEMFFAHQPDLWYFGHWHISWAMKFQKTWFRCVNIKEMVEIGTLGKLS